MASEEIGGAGGKFRRKPARRSATPYARPASALRPTHQLVGGEVGERNSWLSKLVDPASRLITAGAHKLFSSVFRKRLLPSPPISDVTAEIGDVQPEVTTRVLPSYTKGPFVGRGNDPSRASESGGVADLEEILKQKTFTRSEIDHLTALLLSRTDDNPVGDEKERLEPNASAKEAVHNRREILNNLHALENGAECVLPAAISTPVVSSKVLEDAVASPAELAKAYMGSKPTRASPSVLGLQNQMLREDLSATYNPFFKPKSPAMSSIQKPASEIGAPANGFMTPRFRGRSAIYSMARTPYSRPPPNDDFKAAGTAFDVHGASSSSHNATDIHQLSGSKKQVLKRRSSVLESDIGLVGPIRRIRQKPNLLHQKILSLPASGASHVKHGTVTSTDFTEVASTIDWSSNHRSSKAIEEKGVPSTSNGYVPSQSIEMAQKIFQELDKFTSKGKSPEKKINIVGGRSSGNMASDSQGLARKSMNTVDSLKMLQNIQDSRKENGSLDSNARDHSLKISPSVEGSMKKLVIPSVEDGTDAGTPNKASNYMNLQSNFNHQQKKRAFQMSAHEDYLEVDDDVHANGVASAPIFNGVDGNELAKSSAGLSDNPQSAAISAEKPQVPEPKPSTISLGTSKEESLPDGSASTQKITGFSFPVGLSTSSPSSMNTQAAVSSPQPTAEIDKIAGSSEKINEITAYSSNSAKGAPFTFSASSFNAESAVSKEVKPELCSSATDAADKGDGPGKTNKKSTLLFGDVSKKIEDAPSSASSSAKGLFTFGLPSNGATLGNGLSSTVPVTMGVLSPAQISSNSNDQSPVCASESSSPVFSLSNGIGVSTSTLATSAATFGSSSSYLSTSVTAPSISFASGFQFGSSGIPSTSSTVSTPASESAANAETKGNETAFGNATSSLLSAKPSATASSGSNMSGFTVSSTFTTSSKTQNAGAAVASGSIFGFPASSSAIAVSTSTPSFSSQSAFSASSHIFGYSAPASASISNVANTFTSSSVSASSALCSSSVTAPVSSSSNTSSNIFGWPSSKPTAPGSMFGTSSQSSGISFGLTAAGTSAPSNSTLVFGATSSSSAASNSAPYVFGSGSSASASVFSVPSAAAVPASPITPFSSQPLFGSSAPQTFGFGSMPPVGNNDRMSMEDSMAEDSVQVSTPAAPVFGTQISAPSSGFVFGGAAPSTGSPFQFGCQQNQNATQSTPFQPSGSLEFNAGGAGSFSLGSGGGDKSNRRIVKVRNRIRRK